MIYKSLNEPVVGFITCILKQSCADWAWSADTSAEAAERCISNSIVILSTTAVWHQAAGGISAQVHLSTSH